MNPELAKLLDAVGQAPKLGLLLRDGAYQETVREAIRQKAQSISQIQLDRSCLPRLATRSRAFRKFCGIPRSVPLEPGY